MRKALYMALMAAGVAATACAQTSKVLTLDECREMALRNNMSVRNTANDVAAARREQREAFTRYFPTAAATGMAYNANKGLLQAELAPGTRMSMLKDGIMGGISLTQPLFAGGQIVNSNRLAAVGAEVSGIRREQSENEVRLTVELHYWQVVTLQEKMATLRSVERQLKGLEKDVMAAAKAGVSTRNDLLQVQLRQNEVESSRSKLENNLSVCRMMLAQYVGLGTDTIAIESGIKPDNMPDFPQNLYLNPTDALHNTTNYRLLEADVKSNKLQERIAVGKNMPQVALGASYMYDNLMNHSHPFAIGFVSVSVPLSGWWGGSHAIKKQRLQIQNAKNRLDDGTEQLAIAIQKARADLQNTHKQIVTAHRSIEQSTENLRLNEDYYRAGTATMSDLLEAQTLFTQSKDKFVEAYAQFEIMVVEYLLATGR